MKGTTYRITGVSRFYRSHRVGSSKTWIETLMTGDDRPPFVARDTGIVSENGRPVVELPSGRRMNLNYFEYEKVSNSLTSYDK